MFRRGVAGTLPRMQTLLARPGRPVALRWGLGRSLLGVLHGSHCGIAVESCDTAVSVFLFYVNS